jgi:hypothetical protein
VMGFFFRLRNVDVAQSMIPTQFFCTAPICFFWLSWNSNRGFFFI